MHRKKHLKRQSREPEAVLESHSGSCDWRIRTGQSPDGLKGLPWPGQQTRSWREATRTGLRTRPRESYWPRTGGRGGKNSTSVYMGSLLLDTESISWASRLCVEIARGCYTLPRGGERAGLLKILEYSSTWTVPTFLAITEARIPYKYLQLGLWYFLISTDIILSLSVSPPEHLSCLTTWGAFWTFHLKKSTMWELASSSPKPSPESTCLKMGKEQWTLHFQWGLLEVVGKKCWHHCSPSLCSVNRDVYDYPCY